MGAIEFVVPVRLESEANLREHFHAKARRAKEQRAAVTAAVIDAGATVYVQVVKPKKKTGKPKPVARWGLPASSARLAPPTLPCVVTMTRIAPRLLDDDNLARSAKAVRDQLAELLAIDDRDPRVAWRCEQERGGVREYSVRIRLECAS
jgi:hypothetical protein